jgi:hypothetical protein
MSLLLSPNSVTLSPLTDISYPTITGLRTYTTTISPTPPGLSLSPTSVTVKTTVSPALSVGLSTLNTLSPLTTYTPISNNIVGFGGIGTGPVSILGVKPASFYVDIDTGLNDSYVVQQDVTKYFKFKTLDKWLFTDFSSVLKYLVSRDGKVSLIKKVDDRESNDVSKDSSKVLEAKADYIEENILTESKMRAILIRIMKELGIKWFELPHRETLVKEVLEKYLKTKLKKMVLGEDSEDD